MFSTLRLLAKKKNFHNIIKVQTYTLPLSENSGSCKIFTHPKNTSGITKTSYSMRMRRILRTHITDQTPGLFILLPKSGSTTLLGVIKS